MAYEETLAPHIGARKEMGATDLPAFLVRCQEQGAFEQQERAPEVSHRGQPEDVADWYDCIAAVRYLGESREQRWNRVLVETSAALLAVRESRRAERVPGGFSPIDWESGPTDFLVKETARSWFLINLEHLRGVDAARAIRRHFRGEVEPGPAYGAHTLLFERELARPVWSPAFLGLLSDEDPRVRREFLKRFLPWHGAPMDAVEAYVLLLGDPVPEIREKVRAALVGRHPPPLLRHYIAVMLSSPDLNTAKRTTLVALLRDVGLIVEQHGGYWIVEQAANKK